MSNTETMKTKMNRVIRATVRLSARGGQGVLVPGGLVLTAAHCIDWSGEGGMALGDTHPTPVLTRSRARFRLEVLAAEPRADIAVLGELDPQIFDEDATAFEDWAERTKPVPLRMEGFAPGVPGESARVHVRTHLGTWVAGTVTRWGSIHTGALCIEAEEPIKGGTSGGPVVDDEGRLVGVVSNVSLGAITDGSLPLACMALPRWVLDRIKEATA